MLQFELRTSDGDRHVVDFCLSILSCCDSIARLLCGQEGAVSCGALKRQPEARGLLFLFFPGPHPDPLFYPSLAPLVV